jgi:hypothetical protein
MELIVAEARFHTSTVNLGTGAVLADLVRQLLEAGILTVEALGMMTDNKLEQILLETPLILLKEHSLMAKNLLNGGLNCNTFYGSLIFAT